MLKLPQYPSQPIRSIVDAVDVVAEFGPTLGRPLVDRIELKPDHGTTGIGAPSPKRRDSTASTCRPRI